MYKLALVKEACYQDLWTCDQKYGLKNLLNSTLMRIGPIGLLDIFEADFFILKTNKSVAAKKLRASQIHHLSEKDYENIAKTKYKSFNKSPNQIARNPKSINWREYDIVISINFAVPIQIRKKYSNLVWVCLTGEGKFPLGVNNWDYFISHNCPSSPALDKTIIDMPYTLLSPNYLMDNFSKNSIKSGIYFEVNSINLIKNYDLKKSTIPLEFKKLKIPLKFHDGNIKTHLENLTNSKYFIKFGGRPIRGNSLIEAISGGCVCFLSYSDCYGKVNLPSFCYYSDLKELIEKINTLEENDDHRSKILIDQRNRLSEIIQNIDLQFKQAIVIKKNQKPQKNSLSNILLKMLSYLYYSLVIRVKTHKINQLDFLPPIYE